MEIGHQSGHVDRVQCHRADRDRPPDQIGDLVDGTLSVSDRGERGARMGQERGTGLRQSHLATRSCQQRLPDLTFQAPDLRTHRRLCHLAPAAPPW